MFCAECGKMISEGSRFCSACGAPVRMSASAATRPEAPRPQAYQPPQPPLPPGFGPQGPGDQPGRSRRPLLIAGIIAVAMVVVAALAVGLALGLRDGGRQIAAETSGTVPASTTITVPASTTEAPTTTSTEAPTTSTTEAPTTTTEAVTTTTDGRIAALAARAGEWMKLLESIPTSTEDLTPKIASYITPADAAGDYASEYIKYWKEPNDPEAIIANDPFEAVIDVSIWPQDPNSATTICSLKLQCRDGLTTRGLESINWKYVDGQWMRSPGSAVQEPPAGQSVVPLGKTMSVGGLLWAPETLHELKHLSAKGGPAASGMYVTVDFYIKNLGKAAMAPASFQVFAVDAAGKAYSVSTAADEWWDGDVSDRKAKIDPGESTYLWYTFEVPEGADLQTLQYQVLLPGI
jgi:hypothetical protein